MRRASERRRRAFPWPPTSSRRPPPKVLSDRPSAAATVAAASPDQPYPATVHRFDVPFGHLVTFFLKAVIAAIPALILLMAILFGLGKAFALFFPDLAKMKILIGFGG